MSWVSETKKEKKPKESIIRGLSPRVAVGTKRRRLKPKESIIRALSPRETDGIRMRRLDNPLKNLAIKIPCKLLVQVIKMEEPTNTADPKRMWDTRPNLYSTQKHGNYSLLFFYCFCKQNVGSVYVSLFSFHETLHAIVIVIILNCKSKFKSIYN